MNHPTGLTRRDFLRTASLATTAMAASPLKAAPSTPGDRILVILQLSGGNDGLNTVVPIGDDAYRAARPSLALKPAALLHSASGPMGFHPAMRPLMRLWENGSMAVVHGVGHADASHNHFRAVETWHTADGTSADDAAGWLGRYFERVSSAAGVSVGRELPRMMNSGASAGELDTADCAAVLARTEGPTAIDRLHMERMAAGAKSSGVAYGATPAARGLKDIAAMIAAGLEARVYHHEITGFDTHAHQAVSHARLWAEVGDAVKTFFDDLQRRDLAGRVVLMGFSEFGRRVAENNSEGTDHGAAGPVFLWGPRVRGGFHGATPSLAGLDDGDLKCTVDFRSIYATLLDGWLGADHRPILGGNYAKLPLVA